ncbi:MAG: SDR family oxidoreductase [Candidatus Rokubacteria bacterium]|nr:SDR family oxidoreductase [Candidatus Rokubacteria bacterium]
MDLGLRGKVALVTGSSRGIGRAIAVELAREGCRVALCARGKESLEAAAAEVRALGAEAVAAAADVTTEGGVREAVDATLAAFGGIDVLVNNVGGSTGSSFLESGAEEWQRAIDLNLIPAVRLSRLVVPSMRARGGGAIVNVASIYGREWGGAYVRRPTYIAAKAAEIGMSKALAMELAPHGIRVNSVAPGSILFPGGGWARRLQEDPEGIAAFVKGEMPLGRFGRAEEVGRVVAFLASDAASLVLGACLNVDGGQSRSII